MRRSCICNRRSLMIFAGCCVAGLAYRSSARAQQTHDKKFIFMAEAFRMKDQAVAQGDQPYGAVVVRNGEIIGFGPSRVIAERNPDAHAERVALRDAQQRAGTRDLPGALIYSTSRPCAACENALAQANIARMYVGTTVADAGKPWQW